MSCWRVAAVVFLLSTASAAAPPGPRASLEALYGAHDWAALARALDGTEGPALYQGALAEVFNEPGAEGLLSAVAQSASWPPGQVYDAHEWLSHLYLRNGQYRRLTAIMEKRWAAFPGKSEEAGERATLAVFRGLPDQRGGAEGPTALHHDGSIFLPLAVEGGSARYFFDTGAWLSCMSESEAKRLGLTIREGGGSVGTSTGATVGLRTTVAREVTVGSARFADVTFAVFPDDQEPWSILPPGERGLLGMPILLGLRGLRWSQDGTVTVGLAPGAPDRRKANLSFDDDHLIAAVGFQKERVLLTVDTGAETTDLYEGFAQRFATLLQKSGKKEAKEIRGVGHAETFESISVPDLRFEIGGMGTALRPAHVILKAIGAKHSLGNMGLDLLKQARAFRIDFGAMTLELEPKT
jgi:predicted aspartyl protease